MSSPCETTQSIHGFTFADLDILLPQLRRRPSADATPEQIQAWRRLQTEADARISAALDILNSYEGEVNCKKYAFPPLSSCQ